MARSHTYIHNIETSLPDYSYEQDELRDKMKELAGDNEKDRRLIHYIYARSGIRTRYSVLNDFRSDSDNRLFFNGRGPMPGTEDRNNIYIREGRKLFSKTGERLIQNSRFKPRDITHLITVSCTGFYAPGPDFDVIRHVGLNPSIERYHLGFMGCYAAIPALKMAKQICKADENANVMVISAELCTLHFQGNNELDSILSSTVFADGAAGTIVSSRPPDSNGFKIEGFASSILEKGMNDMAWTIGNTGFHMVLSNHIPELLGDGIQNFISKTLQNYGVSRKDIGRWAVHPGGRAILDKVESEANLPDNGLQESRNVLANFGNMSSATILFVLKEILKSSVGSYKEGGKTLAMAFGPGLTLESALLDSVG
ncbi:MAG: type III polyketide synthase [Bacteroidetes bacterium]|jgi:predicted naringenin-chalcone synthase|nr:type III polyketide synthase [Bacteroidota bacterium]